MAGEDVECQLLALIVVAHPRTSTHKRVAAAATRIVALPGQWLFTSYSPAR
jgi:hypothetical protein